MCGLNLRPLAELWPVRTANSLERSTVNTDLRMGALVRGQWPYGAARIGQLAYGLLPLIPEELQQHKILSAHSKNLGTE